MALIVFCDLNRGPQGYNVLSTLAQCVQRLQLGCTVVFCRFALAFSDSLLDLQAERSMRGRKVPFVICGHMFEVLSIATCKATK